jgi:hypothetical protein
MSHHTIAQSNAHSGSIVADATPAPSSPRSTGQGVTLRFSGAPSVGRPAPDLPRDAASALPAIEYRVASLRALTPSGGPSEGSPSAAASPDGSSSRTSAEVDVAPLGEAEVVDATSARTRRKAPSQLLIDGEPVVTTPRFWWSLFMRCGLNEAVFRYFSPTEVFQRVSQLDAGRSVRFAIEGKVGDARPRRLLAVSSPGGPLLSRDAAAELVDTYGGDRIGYAEGTLSSFHTPAVGDATLRIGPDEFKNRFHLEVPVDGLGEPRIHVALLRLVCVNGAIGMRSAFRSTIRIGKDPEHSLDRALAHFANDDGFSAMRQRFESAQRSPASLREVRLLENELARISWGTTEGGGDRRRAFRAMVGDYESRYGLASIEALSIKRQRMLQANCRVYDLINFATEIASHHAPPMAASRLQAWLGATITEEFDLENTANDVPEFVDVFTDVGGRPGVHRN